MLKEISKLGSTLNKTEQKLINGGTGRPLPCSSAPTYYNGYCYLCGEQYEIGSSYC
ncbi:hypothetical protein SAMN05444344_0618 [Tenacibaculum mesophilum]|uniref:Bacteriocin n=1 Tax=Tenacibaculum sp. Pbs-1 TaxID=3238748 RepID=A0AB33L4I8_9FLAO|nr:hypothetical protein [Tenacibaculum mesophilum]GFD81242.1 hypothetical protein KUL118_41040 [Tenacibaculum sp. KUL118]SHF58092.1 hypothetical protein SAMN05444344_0618 [Tenacibaculum mesophilum]